MKKGMQGIWIANVFLHLLFMIQVLGKPNILVSNEDEIGMFTYESQSYTTVVGDLSSVRSLDYDYSEKRVFFIDNNLEERTMIKTKVLGRENSTDIIFDSTDTGEIDWKVLAVDWITKKLYVTDVQSKRVVVTHYDGSCHKVLVSTELDLLSGITLFPQKGLMFVTDCGDSKKIERFNMDGTGRRVLIKLDSSWPESISLDYATSTLYWIDKIENTINSMSIDATNRKKITLANSGAGILTISDTRLFWCNTKSIYTILKSSGDSKGIQSINKIGDKKIKPVDLKVYEEYRQPSMSSECSKNNGGCSHLCLLRPGGITCACPTGIALKPDNKTCEDGMKKFVAFSRRTNIRLISLDVDQTVHFRLNVDKKYTKNVFGVTYDDEKRRVYWTDSGCADQGHINPDKDLTQACTDQGSINSIFINGTGFKRFISNDIKAPDHLAIDWIARNLYWTDAHLARIEVARLDGTSRKIIISDNLHQPRGIAIDPADGKIYWTDWGNSSRIESSDLNGDNRIVLVNKTVKWPNGITIDLQRRKLYWVDPYYKSIFSYDLHSKVVKTIFETANHPFGIAVLGDYIYVTDWHRKILRIYISDSPKKKPKEEILFEGVSIAGVMGICGVDTNIRYGTNPCQYDKNNCSHLCFHKPRIGAVCECPTRMELQNDDKTCYFPTGFLLYATFKGHILKTSVDTYKQSHRLPYSDTNNVLRILPDYHSGKIFWLNINTKSRDYGIYSAYINGSGFKSVLKVGVENVDNIAIDWMARNIYWTNSRSTCIEVARLDGTHQKRLIYGKNVLKPVILLVNPHLRKVYWTQKHDGKTLNNYHSLWQANLDGSSHEMLLDQLELYTCAINFNTSIIYCCNSNNSVYSIISFNPVTRELKTILRKTAVLRNFVVFQHHLLYQKDVSKDIQKLLLKDENNVLGVQQKQPEILPLLISDRYDWILDIQIYHPDTQTGSNLCSDNNGGCEQLCFALGENKMRCGCETHYTLDEDLRSCIAPKAFLLGKQEDSFLRFSFIANQPEAVLTVQNVKSVRSIAYDEIRNLWYVLQGDTKQVVCIHPDRKTNEYINLEKFKNKKDIQPHDIAIDPFTNSLFWTDDKQDTINYLNLASFANGTIFQATGNFPRKIIVYPEKGLLFWTSKDVKNRKSAIYSSLLTGLEVKSLIELERSSEIHDITIDFLSKRLYYLDTGLNHIGSITFQGHSKQEIIIDTSYNPISISIHGDNIFWATNRDIYMVNKSDKSYTRQFFHGKYNGLSNIIAVNMSRGLIKHPCANQNGGCSHICRIDYDVSLGTDENKKYATCGCPMHQNLEDDQKNCTTSKECSLEQFLCKADSKCIPVELRCDGKADCSDEDDEHDSYCSGVYVKAPCDKVKGFKRCGTGLKCVRTQLWCDGHPDCPDKEDEEQSACGISKCTPDHFRCGRDDKAILCLDNSKKCNGYVDCKDGTDEDNCPTPITTAPTNAPSRIRRNRYTIVAIVIGASAFFIAMVFLAFYCKRIRKTKVKLDGKPMLPLKELKSSFSDDHKGSVSTYVSNEISLYGRGNGTGQSELSQGTQLFIDPPPSPMTVPMTTITEISPYGGYAESRCEHCDSLIEDDAIRLLGDGREAPPPTIISTLLDSVDIDLPLDENEWNQKLICDNCQTTDYMSMAPQHKNRLRTNGPMHTHQTISEHDWMDHDAHYVTEPLFRNTNMVPHHLFDPPPSLCTYLSDEDRPPSPAETEQSIAFSDLHGLDRHFAPPPSPTSQLL